MLKHADVWRAVDRLAAKYGMSASGLARRAGLDPTTFNKSKRVTQEGKQRWPSTESISKVLTATGASLAEFVALVAEDNVGQLAQRVPLLSLDQAGQGRFFTSEGAPKGNDWDETLFPQIGDNTAFALEMSDESYQPLYKNGDVLIVSPEASVRRGDRVVVKLKAGNLLIAQLLRESARKIELKNLSRDGSLETLPAEETSWMARIVWASQ